MLTHNQALYSSQELKAALDAERAAIISSNTAIEQSTIKYKLFKVGVQAATMAANMFSSILLAWAVSKGFEILNNWIHRIDNAKERLSGFKSEIDGMNSDFNDHRKLVDEASESYDELAKHVNTANNVNIDLNDEDYQKFVDMNNRLAEAFPELKKGTDEYGNAILDLGNKGETAANQLDELLKKEEALNNFKIAEHLNETFSDTKLVIQDLSNQVKTLTNEIDRYQDTVSKSVDFGFTYSPNVEEPLSFEAVGSKEYVQQKIDEAIDSVIDSGTLSKEQEERLVDFRLDLQVAASGIDNDLNYAEVFYNSYLLDEDTLNSLNDAIAKQQLEIVEAANDARQESQYKLEDVEGSIDTYWVDLQGSLIAAMKSKASFQKMDEASQELAVALVSSLDSSVVSEMDENNPYQYILDNVIHPLRQFLNNPEIPEDQKLLISEFIDPTITEDKRLELYYQLQSLFDGMGIPINITPIVQESVDTDTEFNKSIDRLSAGRGEGESVWGTYNKLNEVTKDFDLEQKKAWNDVTADITIADKAIEKWNDHLKESSQLAEDIKIPSIEESLSGVQKAMGDIEQLTKILGDFKDGEDFDYSSVLNNEAFTEAFSKDKKAYEDFLKVLNDSNATYDEQKKAVEGLATAYLQESVNLEAVTEETMAQSAAMLKQAGITNAEQMIAIELNAREMLTSTKIDEAVATYEAAKAESVMADTYQDTIDASESAKKVLYDEITALSAEAQELGLTADQANAYYLKKLLANSANFDTFGEIQQLNNIVKALGIGTTAWTRYYQAQERMNAISAMEGDYILNDEGMMVNKADLLKQYDLAAQRSFAELQTEIDGISAKAIISPTGGSSGGGGGGGSSEATEVDGFTTALQNLETQIQDVEKAEDDMFDTYDERSAALEQRLGLLRDQLGITQEAYTAYMAEAEKYLTQLPEDLQKLAKSGNKNAINKIPAQYKDVYEKATSWIEKADSMMDKTKETHSALEQGALDRLDLLKARYQDQFDELDYQISKIETQAQIDEYTTGEKNVGLQRELLALQQQRYQLFQQQSSEMDSLLQKEMAENNIVAGTAAYAQYVASLRTSQQGEQQAELDIAKLEKDISDIETGEENEYEQDFDWIERLLERLNKTTEKWTKQAERFFSYWNKNWATNQAILSGRKEIDAQEQAYKYYLKKFNEVELDKAYKNKIINGEINIETIEDEEVGKALEEGIEWYTFVMPLCLVTSIEKSFNC